MVDFQLLKTQSIFFYGVTFDRLLHLIHRISPGYFQEPAANCSRLSAEVKSTIFDLQKLNWGPIWLRWATDSSKTNVTSHYRRWFIWNEEEQRGTMRQVDTTTEKRLNVTKWVFFKQKLPVEWMNPHQDNGRGASQSHRLDASVTCTPLLFTRGMTPIHRKIGISSWVLWLLLSNSVGRLWPRIGVRPFSLINYFKRNSISLFRSFNWIKGLMVGWEWNINLNFRQITSGFG